MTSVVNDAKQTVPERAWPVAEDKVVTRCRPAWAAVSLSYPFKNGQSTRRQEVWQCELDVICLGGERAGGGQDPLHNRPHLTTSGADHQGPLTCCSHRNSHKHS
jgi:hypothetical protein